MSDKVQLTREDYMMMAASKMFDAARAEFSAALFYEEPEHRKEARQKVHDALDVYLDAEFAKVRQIIKSYGG